MRHSRFRAAVRFVIAAQIALALLACSRKPLGDADVVADQQTPDLLSGMLSWRFEADPGSGLAHAVWIETVSGEGDAVRLRVMARSSASILGFAFHLSFPPEGGLRYLSHQFGSSLSGDGVTVAAKATLKEGRLWVGAARFPAGLTPLTDGAQWPEAVMLLEITLVAEREGRFRLAFPVPRRDLRCMSCVASLPSEWLAGSLIVERR